KAGAGEGNRTLVISLEGCCSTIEIHPHPKSRRNTGIGTPIHFDPCSPHSALRLVGEVGLEPTKPLAADLQSAPFAARDTPPLMPKSAPKPWITFDYGRTRLW